MNQTTCTVTLKLMAAVDRLSHAWRNNPAVGEIYEQRHSDIHREALHAFDLAMGEAINQASRPCQAIPATDTSEADKIIAIVKAETAKLDGNGIFSIGARSAIHAMCGYWHEHFTAGHGLSVVVSDIHELIDHLQ